MFVCLSWSTRQTSYLQTAYSIRICLWAICGMTITVFPTANDWCVRVCAAIIIKSTVTKDPATHLSSTSSSLQYTASKEDMASQFTCMAKHVLGPDQVSSAEIFPIHCKQTIRHRIYQLLTKQRNTILFVLLVCMHYLKDVLDQRNWCIWVNCFQIRVYWLCYLS